MASEEISIKLTDIQGQIPSWLKGTLIRNGPVDMQLNNKGIGHWLDGLSMLHAFSFDQGTVTYTNKFLRSEAYNKVFAEKSFDYLTFAADPCHTLFRRFFSFFFPPYANNPNVNIAKYADQYVALTETPLPIAFDPKTLETLGCFNYQDGLPKKDCFESAHPHFNRTSGENMNYIAEYGVCNSYIFYRLNHSCEREVIARIPVQDASYMHTFSITENFIVLTEIPLLSNSSSFINRSKPFIKHFKWLPERGTIISIFDKTGRLIRKHPVAPFFMFHHINAYEDNGAVILDLVSYPTSAIIDDLSDYQKQPNTIDQKQIQSSLTRYTLSEEASYKVVLENFLEFPKINDLYDGKCYQYVYLSDFRDPILSTDERGIHKIDMNTGKQRSWLEKGISVGEPIFIPSPNSVKEDEGVLAAVIHNKNQNNSALVLLNAENLKEIGRAVVPQSIPKGLHGNYYA